MREHCLVSLLISPSGERRNQAPGFSLTPCYTEGYVMHKDTHCPGRDHNSSVCWTDWSMKDWRSKESPLNPLGWRKDLDFPLCCMPNILWAKGSRWRQLGTVNCCLHFSWKFSARWVEIMKNLERQVCHDLRLGNSRCWVSFFVFVFLLEHLQQFSFSIIWLAWKF